MPVRKCERNGESGWKWGEAGKCYLPSEEGGEGKAKQKAILQGVAVEGPDVDLALAGRILDIAFHEEPTVELASLLEVPILTAGEFHPHNSDQKYVVEEEELDEIIEASNGLQPIILEAIKTGEYEGNPELSKRIKESGKPIPGLINFVHQKPLFDRGFLDYIKTLVANASVRYEKRLINGKNWIVKTVDGITAEMADTIQKYYPFRSAELVGLKDPNTGKYHPKVIRSTAYLDILTPPAVPGQSPELIVEFAGGEDPDVVTLSINNLVEEETHNMDKQDKLVDVAELQKVQATLTELQAQMTAQKETYEQAIENARKKAEEDSARIAELAGKQGKAEHDAIISNLSRVRSINGKPHVIKPALLELIEPKLSNSGLIELQEGENYSNALVGMIESIIELAQNGGLTVELGASDNAFTAPNAAKKSDTERVHELAAKEGISKNAAFVKIMNERFGGKR